MSLHRLTAQIRSMAEMHRNIKDNEFVSVLFSFKLTFSADFKWRELGKITKPARLSINKITTDFMWEKVVSWL